MTTRSTTATLAMTMALALAGSATATAEPMSGNIEAELNRTGQVAVPALHADGRGIPGATATPDRPEMRVRLVPLESRKRTPTRISLRDDPSLDSQYGEAFAALVEECHFDVARRRGITPGEITAGVVTIRWTIEPSGRVRDVSAIARSVTDRAVMACAKQVVAGRALLNPVEAPLALEWTYAFRRIQPIAKMMPVSEGPHEP